MIYTSYFANIKKLDGVCYAISGLIPSFYNQLTKQNPSKYKRFIQFAPKKDWWQKWKNGQLDNNQFVKLYYSTVLDKIDITDVLYQFDNIDQDIYLLCYQKPNDFCHRHLVSQWLNKNNVECKQFEEEKQQLELF